MSEATAGVKAGDVVQIDPAHDETFGASLMVVTELKAWGVTGYVQSPGEGRAYYRAPFGSFERVGVAAWVVGDGEA